MVPWLEQQAAIDADALGLDWTVNLGAARERIHDRCALQGNLDPQALFAEPHQIEAEIAATLESFGNVGSGAGHVFNLGHGISQFTPLESVGFAVDAVHHLSRRFHTGQTAVRRSHLATDFARPSLTRFGAE